MPSAIIGHPLSLSMAEGELGYESYSLSVFRDLYGHKGHVNMNLSKDKKGVSLIKILIKLIEVRSGFDIYHFNHGSSMLHFPQYSIFHLDLPLYSTRSKKVVTYVGCDARQKYPTMDRTTLSACHNDKCYNGKCVSGKADINRRKSIEIMDRHAQHMWALNPDLLHFLPKEKSSFLPYALSTDVEVETVDPIDYPIRILHAPTNREAKGTNYVLKVFDNLKAKYQDKVEFILVEGMKNEEALNLYRTAHIVVDQILIGWYGGLAVEVMMRGIPVATRIDEDNYQFIPKEMADDLKKSLINVDPFTLESKLDYYIRNISSLKEISVNVRNFSLKWHDKNRVAKITTSKYNEVLN